MHKLIIQPEKDKFGVNCSPEEGKIEFYGNSYPENVLEFFTPVYEWVEAFMQEVKMPMNVEFKIEYFNTSTSKCLIELFELLGNYYDEGKEVSVKWFFQEGDEDIAETGEELLEDYEFPYDIIEL